MMIRVFAAVCAAFVMMAAPSGPARAQAALPPALDAALADAEARNARNAGVKFYFRRKIVRFGKLFLEKSYNPSAPKERQWAILYPDYKTDPEGYYKQARRQERKNVKHAKQDDYDANRDVMAPDLRPRLARGVTLEREDDNEIVYSFDLADRYYVSGEGKGADIAQYLKGHIAVGKKDGLLHWVHYVAQRPFHPIVIAKVRQFDIYQQFAPAWYGGPLVKVLEKNKVSGTALVRKIRFDDVVTNFDFRPIARTWDVKSAKPGDEHAQKDAAQP